MSGRARVKRCAILAVSLPIALSCAASSGPSNNESVVPAPAPQSPSGATDPVLAAFRENLARARSEAEKAGWMVEEVVEIPEHHCALVRYLPAPERARATRLARLDAVAVGSLPTVTAESGMIDVMKAPGGALTWNLRGDGSTFVVLHLTPCGASCGVAKPLVLELTDQGFRALAGAPECPTCIRDENGDGVPEFELRLGALRVAPCSRASCGPEAALVAEVRGLETWNGRAFSRDSELLEPLYLERLKRAEREAVKARDAPGKRKVCPLHALQVAAQLHVYSRLLGDPERDAPRPDDVMRGYDTTPCAKEYDLLARPKSWKELREDLRAIRLPVLRGGSP